MTLTTIARFQITKSDSYLGLPHLSPALVASVRLSLLAVSWLALKLVAVLAAALGAWRLGADPGWTRQFFVTEGILSHYQLWFALAILAQTAAIMLSHRAKLSALAGKEELR